MSLWPDNHANAFSSTLGADLPWQEPLCGHGIVHHDAAGPGIPAVYDPIPLQHAGRDAELNDQWPAGDQPRSATLPSLNGEVNTLLINNILTTQITSDLKSKFGYRYYDYQNDTMDQFYNQFVGTDEHIYPAGNTPKTAIFGSYTKQNGLAELIWNPLRGLIMGAQYGYERYSWTHNDADETTRNLGKLYATYQAASWLTARGSWEYSARRYGTYTNAIQSSQVGGWNEHYRGPELANLNQNKGKFQVDVVVVPMLTVSPFAGLQYRDYLTDAYGAARELGILKDNSWNAGVEMAIVPTRGTNIALSYTYESAAKNIVGGGGTTGLATSTWNSDLNDNVNTFTATLRQTVIEDKLDLKLSYVYSLANGSWTTAPFFYNGYVPNANPLLSPNPNYPDTKASWQRLDAIATYKLDPSYLRQMGWKADAAIKVRYAWERNRVSNWQIDSMQPYMYVSPFSSGVGGTQTMLWLAGDNPNYNVHLLALALELKW